MIYLDNSATTFPKPEEFYKAIDYANRNLAFNAGRGLYKQSSRAYDIISKTKDALASLCGLHGDKVAFTSSATESLNLIINGLGIEEGDNVYISPFEHNAIVRPLYNLKRKIDFNIIILPFDKKTWQPNIDEIQNMFAAKNPKCVLLSHVSNVTGYVLPYKDIFGISKKYDSVNVLDCAQSYGVINPNTEFVDFIVFAGHKSLYAGLGIAGFININDIKLDLTKTGGSGSDSLNHYMPDKGNERYESGSQNIVAIYGLSKSLEWLKDKQLSKHSFELSTILIEELAKLPKVTIYKPLEPTLGIVSINVKGYRPEDVGSILSDEFDICVRTGYHCAPFVHKFLGTEELGGTIRISVGAFTSTNEIKQLLKAIKSL